MKPSPNLKADKTVHISTTTFENTPSVISDARTISTVETEPSASALQAYADWFRSGMQGVVFEVLVTLKRQKPLNKHHVRQPAHDALVREERVFDDLNVKKWRIKSIDALRTQNVRARSRPRTLSLDEARLYDVHGARREYLQEDEPDKIARRLIYQLNRQTFGAGKARRAKDPMRLQALVNVHDRDRHKRPVRPHIHAVIEMPPNTTPFQMDAAVKRGLKKEPFAHRFLSVQVVRGVDDMTKYVADATKSTTGNVMLFSRSVTATSSDPKESTDDRIAATPSIQDQHSPSGHSVPAAA